MLILSARTPKLQLPAEQPSRGECWIPPRKDTSCPRAKEKPQQDGRRGKILNRINPYTCQRHLEGSKKKNLVSTRRPHRDWTRPGFEGLRFGSAVACCRGRGSGCCSPRCGISLLGGGHHYPDHRTARTYARLGNTDCRRAQTKPCANQELGEKSSDPTRKWPRLARECPGFSSRGVGQRWPAAGSGALNITVCAWDLLKEVAIIFITSTIAWSQVKQQGGNPAPPINRKLD